MGGNTACWVAPTSSALGDRNQAVQSARVWNQLRPALRCGALVAIRLEAYWRRWRIQLILASRQEERPIGAAGLSPSATAGNLETPWSLMKQRHQTCVVPPSQMQSSSFD